MKKKYLDIYQELVLLIREGKLLAGERLPSEHELCSRYGTSRETIRKALNLLSQNGYIQKVRGKGSIVLDRNKIEFPVSGLTSFKELAEESGQQTNTRVVELYQIEPNQKVMELLQCPKDSYVWKIVRTREMDGEKVILDKDYIRGDIVERLTKTICEDSIYSFIEDDLGLAISFAKKEIVVEPVTEEDETHIDVETHDQVVVIRSFVYLEDTTLFQYTESRHRPDKFRFVDFARRSKGERFL
ncbi:trehalose operon repressor [Thalassobacillus pellis]|uniref:trehalose operon repressor n=1 Tax=Thalassobacillus pellis TaxID=748008 RepID=UPI001961AB96|nr:trehalose operon repressor [Thalassobacillus pellis]MBM7551945.1 GntR family trehalose operon transcriptional repressor [Thalassobacillus pellis]